MRRLRLDQIIAECSRLRYFKKTVPVQKRGALQENAFAINGV